MTDAPTAVPDYYWYYHHDTTHGPTASPVQFSDVESYFDKISAFIHSMANAHNDTDHQQLVSDLKPATDLNIAAVLATAKLNLVVFVVLMTIFETLRVKIPSIYDGRRNHIGFLRSRKRLSPMPFSWVRSVTKVPWTDIRSHGGLDAYMFLRFIRLCGRVTSVFTFWAVLVLFPVYATGGNQAVGFYHLSMANVAQASYRLWVPTIFMYILTAYTLYIMDEEFKHFVKLRMNFLAKGDLDVDPQQRYSLLVEQIPNSLRSDSALYDYFNSLFPGRVHSASVVLKVVDLEAVVLRRMRVLRRLEKAHAYLTATNKRPIHVVGRARIMFLGVETQPFQGCMPVEDTTGGSVVGTSPYHGDKDLNNADKTDISSGRSGGDDSADEQDWEEGSVSSKSISEIYTETAKGRLVDSIIYYTDELKQMNKEVKELQAKKINLANKGAQTQRAEDWYSRTLDFLSQQLGLPQSGPLVTETHEGGEKEKNKVVISEVKQNGSTYGAVGKIVAPSQAPSQAGEDNVSHRQQRKPPMRYHSKYEFDTSRYEREDFCFPCGYANASPSSSDSDKSGSSSLSFDDHEQLMRKNRLIDYDHLREPVQPGGEDKGLSTVRRIVGRLGLDFAVHGFKFIKGQFVTVVETVVVPTMSATGFVTFNDLAAVTCAGSAPLCHRPDVIRCKVAPEPRDLVWKNVHVDLNVCERKESMFNLMLVLGCILWSIPLAFIQAVATASTLAKIPGLGWLTDEEGEPLSALINGYLPVAALLVLISVLPFIFHWIASTQENRKTSSSVQESILGRYFYYQMANIYVTVTAGSIWESLFKIIDEPRQALSILGRALPQVVGYFISLLLTKIMAGLPMVLMRSGAASRLLLLRGLFSKDKLTQREIDEVYRPQELWYGWEYPTQLLVVIICFTYAVISPCILPFGAIYFYCALIVYKKQVLHVYTPIYESGGSMFPGACLRMLVGLIGSHLTLVGYLIIRRGFFEPIFLVPLPYFTYRMFTRFSVMYDVPSRSLSLERASELDRHSKFDPSEVFHKDAYRQPVLAEAAASIEPYRGKSYSDVAKCPSSKGHLV